MKVQDFKQLMVWRKGKALAVLVYKMTKAFPKDEMYGITSQMRRACVSIPSNISEGSCRQHTGEYIQFIYTAMGSAAELETQLLISEELGYLGAGEKDAAIDLIQEIQRMLNGLVKALRGRIKERQI